MFCFFQNAYSKYNYLWLLMIHLIRFFFFFFIKACDPNHCRYIQHVSPWSSFLWNHRPHPLIRGLFFRNGRKDDFQKIRSSFKSLLGFQYKKIKNESLVDWINFKFSLSLTQTFFTRFNILDSPVPHYKLLMSSHLLYWTEPIQIHVVPLFMMMIFSWFMEESLKWKNQVL